MRTLCDGNAYDETPNEANNGSPLCVNGDEVDAKQIRVDFKHFRLGR